jgi:peptidoglycan/LPS O-acetylase OafA/YrhL
VVASPPAPAGGRHAAAAHGYATEAPGSIGYRPDIDGLRAVAVLSVFAYHLKLPWFPGGFVGVDIFFVISGYLIASIIIKELRRGTFSISRFYARRVRRIVPALAVLLFVIAGIEFFTAFPTDLRKFAESALACVFSISNIFFLEHANYFDAAAGTQPLLHTWSLAVEEQFYVVFPALAFVLVRWAPRLLVPCLGLLWCGSLAVSSYGAFTAPEASFYLAHSRAWELLSGVLLATRPMPLPLNTIARNAMAALGGAMIALSVFVYSVETPFPGLAALLPCLGTVLVIAAGQSGLSLVGWLLSLRPVVFIGLISYSLYLWHWPVIYFQDRIGILGTGLSWKAEKLVVILASLALATASWRFVELPFRGRFAAAANRTVLATGVAALCAIGGIASVFIATDGAPARFTPQAIAYAKFLDYGQKHLRLGTCFIDPPYTFADFDRAACLTTQPGRPNILLLGDSHAAQLWYGLAKLLPGVNVLQATAAGCTPEFRPVTRVYPSCRALMDFVFNRYLPTAHLDRLILAARWDPRHIPALREVLNWARSRGLAVTVAGPMVEYDAPLPRVLAEASEHGDMSLVQTHVNRSYADLDRTLAALAAGNGAQYVSFLSLLCHGAVCDSLADDGAPLEFDTDHLTAEGSLTVARKMIGTGEVR